uniref:Uncharacterized protein n=1 Tax=Panagrolaimus sp. PS1159 TaxID=55785 RepID=A0AC35GN84_9BILA
MDSSIVPAMNTEKYQETINENFNFQSDSRSKIYFNKSDHNDGSDKSETLSLHILKYESSFDADNYTAESKIENLKKSSFGKSLKDMHRIVNLGSNVGNMFEIPRQQNQEAVEPEVMGFRASQRLLNPNEPIAETISLLDPKEKLFKAILDKIYTFTSKSVNIDQIYQHWALFGHDRTLDNALKYLGYYSLNDFIRQNENYFLDFLEIFVVTKDDETFKGQMPKLVLYYFNKNLQQSSALNETTKESLIIEQRSFDRRYKIAFHETKFFEYHNSQEYINGRKSFARIVEICQNENRINENGFVPLHKFQETFQNSYGESFQSLLKTFFPNSHGLQDIMKNIMFEEVSSKPDFQGTNIQFSLYSEDSFEQIVQRLDIFQNEAQQFLKKVYTYFSFKRNEKRNLRRPNEQRQNISTSYHLNALAPINVANQRPSSYFVDSDDEEDLRVENQKFIIERRTETVISNKTASENLKYETKRKIDGYKEVIGKCIVLTDLEIEKLEFINEDLQIEENEDDNIDEERNGNEQVTSMTNPVSKNQNTISSIQTALSTSSQSHSDQSFQGLVENSSAKPKTFEKLLNETAMSEIDEN